MSVMAVSGKLKSITKGFIQKPKHLFSVSEKVWRQTTTFQAEKLEEIWSYDAKWLQFLLEKPFHGILCNLILLVLTKLAADRC